MMYLITSVSSEVGAAAPPLLRRLSPAQSQIQDGGDVAVPLRGHAYAHRLTASSSPSFLCFRFPPPLLPSHARGEKEEEEREGVKEEERPLELTKDAKERRRREKRRTSLLARQLPHFPPSKKRKKERERSSAWVKGGQRGLAVAAATSDLAPSVRLFELRDVARETRLPLPLLNSRIFFFPSPGSSFAFAFPSLFPSSDCIPDVIRSPSIGRRSRARGLGGEKVVNSRGN
jgi:hypothetical protein